MSQIYLQSPLGEDSMKYEISEKEYPEIFKYLSEFQVKLDGSGLSTFSAGSNDLRSRVEVPKNSAPALTAEPLTSSWTRSNKLGPSITVFKKKDLKKMHGLIHQKYTNIYEHNQNHNINLNEQGKSVVSCVRCRKLKKRCSRSIPECSNCSSSDDLCVYVPRKSKAKINKEAYRMEGVLSMNKINLQNSSSSVLYNGASNLPQENRAKKRLSLPNTPIYSSLESSPVVKNQIELQSETIAGQIDSNLSRSVNLPSPTPSILGDSSSNSYSYSLEPKLTKRHSNDFRIILN